MVSLVDIYNVGESTFERLNELKSFGDPARGNKGKNRSKEFYFVDVNSNGHLDRMEQSFYRWLLGDNIVAQNTAQFQEYYATIPARYNREKLNELGNQYTLSGVVGLSYYLHQDSFFILAYGNYFFVNEKITEYGSDTSDYDFGVIANWKLNRSFSFYTQLEYLKYFERENYTINLGINLIII